MKRTSAAGKERRARSARAAVISTSYQRYSMGIPNPDHFLARIVRLSCPWTQRICHQRRAPVADHATSTRVQGADVVMKSIIRFLSLASNRQLPIRVVNRNPYRNMAIKPASIISSTMLYDRLGEGQVTVTKKSGCQGIRKRSKT